MWTWNEAAKELKQHQVRLGRLGRHLHELISGDVKVGDQLVTGVILPASMRATTTGNPLLGGPQNRNMGGMGMQPGGGGPAATPAAVEPAAVAAAAVAAAAVAAATRRFAPVLTDLQIDGLTD